MTKFISLQHELAVLKRHVPPVAEQQHRISPPAPDVPVSRERRADTHRRARTTVEAVNLQVGGLIDVADHFRDSINRRRAAILLADILADMRKFIEFLDDEEAQGGKS